MTHLSRAEACRQHVRARAQARFQADIPEGYFRAKIEDGTAYLIRPEGDGRSLWLVPVWDGWIGVLVFDEIRNEAVSILRLETFLHGDPLKLMAAWLEHVERSQDPVYAANRLRSTRAYLDRRIKARIRFARQLVRRYA